MRPTPLTNILLLCSLVFFGYAWLMNTVAAAGAGIALLMLLAIRAAVFQTAEAKLIHSITVQRDVDSLILNQSSVVHAVSSLTAVTGEMTASFEDILPAGAVLISGSTTFAEGSAKYAFNLPVIGGSYFGVLRVFCRDRFFLHTILMKKNADEPKLTMYPTGIAATRHISGLGSGWSTTEYDRPAVIKGTDTRMFRQYIEGDSILDIDWKLTGKYQDPYVRIKMDASSGQPVVIVDLPGVGTTPELGIQFAEMVTGIQDSVKSGDDFPVIFISGAVYLAELHSGDTEAIYAWLRQAGTLHQTDHLFRLSHPKQTETTLEVLRHSSTPYSKRVKELMQQYAGRYPTDFEQRVHAISSTLVQERHIIYITAAVGDLSHMTYLISETKKNDRTASVYVAGCADPAREEELRDLFIRAGADTVEMQI